MLSPGSDSMLPWFLECRCDPLILGADRALFCREVFGTSLILCDCLSFTTFISATPYLTPSFVKKLLSKVLPLSTLRQLLTSGTTRACFYRFMRCDVANSLPGAVCMLKKFLMV